MTPETVYGYPAKRRPAPEMSCAAATLDAKAGYFRCPDCGHLFVPEMKDCVKGRHTFTKRRLTCPECGKTGMCRHIIMR